MKYITETFEDSIKVHILLKYGKQKNAAEALGISASMLNSVIHGRKNPTKAILDDMGLERVVIYREKETPTREVGGQIADESIADFKALRKRLLANPQEAKSLLQKAGIWDENGELTEAFGGKPR